MYKWSISELSQTDGKVIQVKYRCETACGKVATEGYWKFRKSYKLAADTHEQQVAQWLEMDSIQDGKNLITARLDEQLMALENAESCDPPWKVETFKVQL